MDRRGVVVCLGDFQLNPTEKFLFVRYLGVTSSSWRLGDLATLGSPWTLLGLRGRDAGHVMHPQLSWPAFPPTPLSKKFQERKKAWQAAGQDTSRLSGKSLAIISRYYWVALV
jgi:hypothetical protein